MGLVWVGRSVQTGTEVCFSNELLRIVHYYCSFIDEVQNCFEFDFCAYNPFKVNTHMDKISGT
jgi:hypothetical protein